MSDLLDRIARLSPTKKRLLARQLGVEPGDGSSRDPIAIIGMACRFPGGEASPRGVDHPAAYWDLLTSGMDAIREVPADRWDADVYFSPDADIPGTMYTKWGGFVDGVDQFDAAFFGIAPREAANMDPQQRLFLEVAWEALESAGLDLGRLAGSSTGVYLGQCSNDYLFLNEETAIEAYAITGSSHCMGANRLSYLLDLKGPSFEVDTACSSSLVALHLACEGLRHGECEMALVGGANLILTPGATISFSRWGVLARDGRCKVFDARADGYVRGEGCGAVVLKRLSQARADGDPIHAVIKGTAVGQDGRSAGLTAPSVQGQAMVLRRALDNAGVDPADVGLIETHGTGTSLGDPIEVEALAGVYGVPRPEGSACALGAVKSCFGHLEAAAGVASVIKAVLALRHGQVPPNLHFQRLNPAINLSGTGFIIPTSTTAWPSTAPTRSAGVSSFGFGGTNAHVILEEAGAEVEAERPLAPQRPAWVLPVSARSELALRSRAGQMAGVLETDQRLADVVYTAARRRTAYPYRLAVVGTGASELSEQLGAFVSGESRPGLSCDYVAPGTRPRLVLVFPGQGSQWLGMGRRLAATEPVFRSCLATIQEAFRAFVDWSLLEQLEDPLDRPIELVALGSRIGHRRLRPLGASLQTTRHLTSRGTGCEHERSYQHCSLHGVHLSIHCPAFHSVSRYPRFGRRDGSSAAQRRGTTMLTQSVTCAR